MKYILIIIALILFKLYQIGATPVAQVQAAPTVEQVAWTTALADRLGNSSPSPDMLKFLDAWVRAEGTAAAFNPLATTKPMPGSSDFNSVHVQNYTSVEDGLNATALTLQGSYPGYSDIVAGIQTNDVMRAFEGLRASPWGTQADLVAEIYNGHETAPPVVSVASTTATDIRQAVIKTALAQVGKPYVLGTAGASTFDCSGLVQWTYRQYGILTTRTTFTQLDNLRKIEPNQVQPGDMIYFQYSWDQHVGILADLDGDGKWDMIHAAAPGLGVIVTNDVFSDSFYTGAIIGYRTAL